MLATRRQAIPRSARVCQPVCCWYTTCLDAGSVLLPEQCITTELTKLLHFHQPALPHAPGALEVELLPGEAACCLALVWLESYSKVLSHFQVLVEAAMSSLGGGRGLCKVLALAMNRLSNCRFAQRKFLFIAYTHYFVGLEMSWLRRG